jgi:hypothetical protein
MSRWRTRPATVAVIHRIGGAEDVELRQELGLLAPEIADLVAEAADLPLRVLQGVQRLIHVAAVLSRAGWESGCSLPASAAIGGAVSVVSFTASTVRAPSVDVV